MLFIGVALLVAIGLTFLISQDAGSLIGLEQNQFGQLVVLLSVLILVASGGFGKRIRFNEMVAGALAWVGIFAFAFFGYSYRTEIEQFGSRFLSELSPGTAHVSEDGASVRFSRSMSGSFIVKGEINHHQTKFIFDTGATAVVLTVDDARKAGIDVERLRYVVPVRTANGETTAAAARIEQLDVGGIVRQNIPALVAQRDQLETSLLGMTFLETLGSYTVTKDALEFRSR